MNRTILQFRDKDGYLLEIPLERAIEQGDLYLDFGGHKRLVLDFVVRKTITVKPKLNDDDTEEQ